MAFFKVRYHLHTQRLSTLKHRLFGEQRVDEQRHCCVGIPIIQIGVQPKGETSFNVISSKGLDSDELVDVANKHVLVLDVFEEVHEAEGIHDVIGFAEGRVMHCYKQI